VKFQVYLFMTIIRKNALIPYSASKMYQLVLDVNRYHEFLPWCSMSSVLSHTEQILEGKITIDHSVFKKSFVTRNTLTKDQKIEMKLLEGPFKTLDGVWEFTFLDKNCSKISLNLEFEFSSKLLSMALGPVFSQIANSMVDSFCQRAVSIYHE
ncbi:MAG: type II toxin-antitoxin system RatA family toxin, partial [Pseudomonadota bacterium]